ELGFRQEILRLEHDHLGPKIGWKETMPVDRRAGGDDSIVVIRVALGLHQTLAATGRAADKIGIARGLAIECLCECLTHHGHFVNAEISIIPDRLPVQRPFASSAKLPLPPS